MSGQQSFDGNVYNLRLWDAAMSEEQLKALTCDQVGSVIDWDNSYWTIPAGVAQTDGSLSCSEYGPGLNAACSGGLRGNGPASHPPSNTVPVFELTGSCLHSLLP